MTLAMTLMVRDEADVIRPMIEHSFAQGVDRLIVTDNGSVDGTREILADLAAVHPIEVRDDPVHRKQQHTTVTQMARDAHTRYGADWVINADADEFWFPVAADTTLREVFERMPRELRAVQVPVRDMTGAPARDGTGFRRLIYRDDRSVEDLHAIGLFAHSTPDMVHVGTPDVTVAQGNHTVDFEPAAPPPDQLRIEVLHLPWRSWAQFERKVSQSGRAYESNPDLLPSPNHHGMREYRRWKAGVLLPVYLARHPDEHQLAAGLASGAFTRDDRLAGIADPVGDVPFDDVERRIYAEFGRYVVTAETTAADAAHAAEERIRALDAELAQVRSEVVEAHAELGRQKQRRVVRIVDGVARLRHPVSDRQE